MNLARGRPPMWMYGFTVLHWRHAANPVFLPICFWLWLEPYEHVQCSGELEGMLPLTKEWYTPSIWDNALVKERPEIL